MSAGIIRTIMLTIITMIAFAMNSIFGRLALGTEAIDPASYTGIRLISGALMLLLLVTIRGGFSGYKSEGPFWSSTGLSALALFVYAAFFSFSYITVDTGVGALILFACVQATMIGWGLYKGERPSTMAWIGIVMAIGGLVYLLSPGLTAPDPFGAFLMVIAGIAWGVYSLKGRGLSDPLRATARNFIYSVPLAVLLMLLFINIQHLEAPGVMLAISSGAITSALGYAIWYETLKGLTATKAAIVQLTVPIIAGVGGLVLVFEPITLRFIVASALILGGVALVTLSKDKS